MNLGIAERFTITTPLSIEEIQARLSTKVEPPQQKKLWSFQSTWKRKPYEGIIGNTGFQIERKIDYQNSFIPSVKGTFVRQQGSTQVEISVDMNEGVLIFSVFWTIVVVLFGIFTIGSDLAKGSLDGSAIWLVGLFFLVGTVGPIVGFQYEVQKSKAFLYSLFEAEQHTSL